MTISEVCTSLDAHHLTAHLSVAESELDLMPGALPEFYAASDSSHELPPWIPATVLLVCHVCPRLAPIQPLEIVLDAVFADDIPVDSSP